MLSSAIIIFISKWKIFLVILEKMFLKKIIFLLLAKSWAEKCPDGWDEFQGHCYMIGTNFYENSKLRTWHNAKVSLNIYFSQLEWLKFINLNFKWLFKADCELLGSHLAVIETQEENDFLNSRLPSLHSPWIGLFDPSERYNSIIKIEVFLEVILCNMNHWIIKFLEILGPG